MKKYINDIVEECLQDEVDVNKEWERLLSSIEGTAIIPEKR